jgi:tetratricopeptide (TPR) repeat protein
MAHKKVIITMLICAVSVVNPLLAQEKQEYPQDARKLRELARDLWAPVELQGSGYIPSQLQPHIAEHRIRQSCLLLEAAVALDPSHAASWQDLIVLYTSDAVNDPGRAMNAVVNYNQLNPQDAQPVETFLRYRLQNLDDRPTREQFLRQTIPTIRDYPYIQSIAYTELGILAQEKLDQENARTFFEQAIITTTYNDEAMVRLLNLPWPQVDETNPNLTPEQISQAIQNNEVRKRLAHITRWRTRLMNNPYDAQAVTTLIGLLEREGQYKLTQDFYEHAYTLFTLPSLPLGHEIPDRESLAQDIRFRQIVSCYTGKFYDECITLAQLILKKNPEDLLVSGLTAKAMLKLNPDITGTEASLMLRQAADRAMQKLLKPDKLDARTYYRLQSELAWFFCFFDPDPVRALHFARTLPVGTSGIHHPRLINRDSSAVSRSNSILAYAHTMNEQWQKAEELLQNADPNDPVAALAGAKVLIHQNQNDDAIQKLKNVDLSTCGILAEPIEQILIKIQPDTGSAASSPPIPGTSPETAPDLAAPANATPAEDSAEPQGPEPPDLIEMTLTSQFNNNDLLIVKAPEKAIQCSMWLTSDIFQYGSPINAKIYLSNISDSNEQDALVKLAPDSFLDPHLLITAEIYPTVSDQGSREKPLILAHRYMIQRRLLVPGASNVINENLYIGPLRKILEDNPRQTYQIIFRLYLDPVPDGKGGFTSKIAALQPKTVTVIRKAFVPTSQRMQEYTRSIQKGTPDERIKAIRLFTALLREMKIAPERYRGRSLNSTVIRELIQKNLNHSDFRVRGWTAHALSTLSAVKAQEAKYLGSLLNDENWFARLMTIRTLSAAIDLSEYFRWSDTLEKNEILKRQVQLLRGFPWQVVELPEIKLPPEPETAPGTAEDAGGQTNLPGSPSVPAVDGSL